MEAKHAVGVQFMSDSACIHLQIAECISEVGENEQLPVNATW